MTKSTKTLTGGAILTALGFALLYSSALLPSGRLAMVAVAGFATAAAVIHCGKYAAIMVFSATAALGLIICPDKGNAILYSAFFGHYPIVKSLIEGLKNAPMRLVLKLILFNIVFCALWILSKELFLSQLPELMVAWPIVGTFANVAFIIYDIGLTKLISLYISRVSTRI